MARLIRAYFRTSKWERAFVGRFNAAFLGLWLGFLDREALAQLDEAFYETTRESLGDRTYKYVDDEWNLQGLRSWEARLVEAHIPEGGRVLVTGAGGGREVVALLERGFDAMGYEPNPKLVEAGLDLLERQGQPARLGLQERDAFPADAGRCDCVLVGWGSYMLIPGRRRRVEFLRGARAFLPEGAPILLSFFTRDRGPGHLRVVALVANVVRHLRGRGPVEFGDTLAPNYVHYFTRDEIQAELGEAGFQLVGFASEPYGHAVGTVI